MSSIFSWIVDKQYVPQSKVCVLENIKQTEASSPGNYIFVFAPPKLTHWSEIQHVFLLTENKPVKYIHLPASNAQSFSFFRELEVRYMYLCFTLVWVPIFLLLFLICLFVQEIFSWYFFWWLPLESIGFSIFLFSGEIRHWMLQDVQPGPKMQKCKCVARQWNFTQEKVSVSVVNKWSSSKWENDVSKEQLRKYIYIYRKLNLLWRKHKNCIDCCFAHLRLLVFWLFKKLNRNFVVLSQF